MKLLVNGKNTQNSGKIVVIIIMTVLLMVFKCASHQAGQQEPVDPNLCGQFSSSDLGVCVVSAVVNKPDKNPDLQVSTKHAVKQCYIAHLITQPNSDI